MSGKILVLGATGNVGTQLVKALLAKGEKVKAATRHATPVPGAEAVAFDLAKPANLPDVLQGVDRIYLLVPTGHMNPKELTLPIIAAAAERNIKVVLQTAMGVDADDNIPYRQVELALIKSGAKHVILRPNWFSDNFQTYWSHGVKQGVVALPAAEGKTSFVDVRDIAASAAAALTTNIHDGKAFTLTGPEALGYTEAVDLISKATGRKVAYQPIDDATFIGILVAGGVPAEYAGFLATIFGPVREGWTATVTKDVETLAGEAPRNLETYVRDNVKALAA